MLLILAGVTIAQLTGSDSAPVKANEAKQKNDIGAAKDDVALAAQNAQTEAYERVYVEGKQINSNDAVTAGNASTEVGTYVRNKLNQKYGTAGTFKIGLATITATTNGEITISTTDFTETGDIAELGGALTWNGLQLPPPENAVESLAKKGTIKVGDYVNYTPSSGTYKATAELTGHSADQTFSTADNSSMTWRVLSVDNATGEVKIVGSPTTQQLTLYGKAGFGNAEIVLNNIGAIFGGGTGSASARSITEDDIFDAIGYDKVANYVEGTQTYTSGELFTETSWNENTVTAKYSTTTTTATTQNPITLHYTAHTHYDEDGVKDGGINVASQTLENGTATQKNNMQIIWQMLIGENYTNLYSGYNYWCATQLVSDGPYFYVLSVADGEIGSHGGYTCSYDGRGER